MILAPASDAADQSEPEEQESSDLQPKNLADPSKRLQKTADSRRNSLKNPPALLPFLKRPGRFAQHGADRGCRGRLCPQRIRKTAHKAILDQFGESCRPESGRQMLRWSAGSIPELLKRRVNPVLEKALKLPCRPWHPIRLELEIPRSTSGFRAQLAGVPGYGHRY